MTYTPSKERYGEMVYNRSGKSGLKFPAISLGLWHNFSGRDLFENGREMIHKAFDLGITHFDAANNYGPPPGSAEETLGKILKNDLKSYRDELIISTKAGYDMWEGPYGNFGSRKYLISSIDQSLNRLGLDYVDISLFFSKAISLCSRSYNIYSSVFIIIFKTMINIFMILIYISTCKTPIIPKI